MRALPVARRATFAFADQAVASGTNFALGILIARNTDAEGFGAFSIAFATFVVALVIARALTSEPFVIRVSGASQGEWRQATAEATGLAVVIGVVAAGVFAIAALIVGGPVGSALMWVALAVPILLIQDTWRFAFIADGRPERAFATDAILAAIIVPGLAALAVLDVGGVPEAVVVWAGAAAIASFASQRFGGVRPAPRSAVRWLRSHLDIAPRFTIEGLVSLSASQLTLYVVGLVAGLAAAGGFRGGQLLLGPMQVLALGVGIIAVPEGVRFRAARGTPALIRPAVAVSVALALATLGWGLILALLPAEVGRAILGETWDHAAVVLIPLALAYAAGTSSMGAGVAIRVLADARRSLTARSLDALAQLAGGSIGAVLGGAIGAAVGLALGACVGATIVWVFARQALRAGGHSPSTTPAASDAMPVD